jgi:hypothetical protein
MQTEKVISQRLDFGTVFRIVLTGNLIGTLILVVIPMFVLSLMSAFGAQIFKSGDEYLTGIKALLAGAAVAVIWIPWTVFWSAATWLSLILGLWVYSKFKPFAICYKPLP